MLESEVERWLQEHGVRNLLRRIKELKDEALVSAFEDDLRRLLDEIFLPYLRKEMLKEDPNVFG